MRGALHVIATIAVAPYAVLATAFVLLGHAIAGGSLLSFLDRLLQQTTWIIPWGMIGFPLALLVLAALGLHARSRWVAGLILCLIACTSVAVIICIGTTSIEVGQVLFLLPCIGAAVVGGWLAIVERPGVEASRVR